MTVTSIPTTHVRVRDIVPNHDNIPATTTKKNTSDIRRQHHVNEASSCSMQGGKTVLSNFLADSVTEPPRSAYRPTAGVRHVLLRDAVM